MINLSNISHDNLDKAIRSNISITQEMKQRNEKYMEIIQMAKEISNDTKVPFDFAKIVLFELNRKQRVSK